MRYALLLGAVAAFMAGAMTVAWIIAADSKRTGWIDAIWSFSTALAGAAAALVPAPESPGPRQWVVAGLAMVWGLRLGGHIAVRNLSDAGDPRYAQLRRDWGQRWRQRLFVFLQVQALCGWLLALSVFAAARTPARFPDRADLAGLLLLGAAVLGETVADRQLAAFRAVRSHEGRVCTAGLWRLSRHPNYFFEWLGWLAYPVIALGPLLESGGDPRWGWLSLIGPVLMYALLVHVSGIPPLEAHMLRTRGDAFRKVQRAVRAFWPIPRFRS